MLTLLLAGPLVGLLVILMMPSHAARAIRSVALAATGAALLVGLWLLNGFDASVSTMQFSERVVWIPQIQIYYHLGIDGISLPMVLLTVVLGFLACVASACIQSREKEYYVLYLLLEVGMLGTFVALDLFLFYVFWELVLVPMYFLIGIWGGGRREYSAFKFFVYTLVGSLAMLLAILALYFRLGTFDMLTLAAEGRLLPLSFQRLLFLAFFVAFAIKVPVFPFHTWLPDAHVDAPTPISVILAGVLLKMGGYAFLRISYPILPGGALWFAGSFAVLGVISIVYGALCAMAQTDLKKLVAYSSVSHMGFVVLGLASLTQDGMRGAMFQMVSHGLITGGMFLMVGALYDRSHTRDLDAFGGLGVRLPVFSGIFIFLSMASLGLPGLSGFVGEFLSLIGAFGVFRPHVVISVLGIIVVASFTLTAVQKVLLGPLNEKWRSLRDMNARELCSVVPLVVLVLALGIYPLMLLTLQDESLQALLRQMLGT